MSSTLVDLVKIVANNSGSGAIVLGAAVDGYRGKEKLLNGATYSYSIQQGSQFEFGTGLYITAGNLFVRSPQDSSNGGTAISLLPGAEVAFVALAKDILARDVLQPLYGYGPPLPGVGQLDQVYYDLNSPVTLYGPKTDAGWGSGVSLQGDAMAIMATLAAFKAGSIINKVQFLQDATVGPGLFNWETANAPYTADDITIIKADSTALSVGAWVRQNARGVAYTSAEAGSINRMLSAWIDDQAVSAANFPNWASDPASAIRAAIATGKDVYVPYVGTLTLASSLGTTAANQRIFGRGRGITVLKKGFNGDVATMGLGSSFWHMTITGDGSNKTGRGAVISSGSSAGTGFQTINFCSIVDMAGYCVEWTANAAGWGGGMLNCDVQRTGNTGYCLKMPDTETNGNRTLTDVFAGSGPLIDFGGTANVQLANCSSGSAAGPSPAWAMTAACAKVQIIGGRFGVGTGTTTLLGQNHVVTGISMAGTLNLGDGSANSLVNSQVRVNDVTTYVYQPNLSSGNGNDVDIPTTPFACAWTGSSTNPVLGNGSLNTSYSRSGRQVLFELEFLIGSTTTFGSGSWSFSLPMKAAPRAATGTASMIDISAGTHFIGAARISADGTTLQVYPHQANIMQPTSPFTWAVGDSMTIGVPYLAA